MLRSADVRPMRPHPSPRRGHLAGRPATRTTRRRDLSSNPTTSLTVPQEQEPAGRHGRQVSVPVPLETVHPTAPVLGVLQDGLGRGRRS